MNTLRDTVLPKEHATSYVTGTTAGGVDFTSQIASRLPWLILAVVALSFILLTTAFRSVVIATKAAILNILSIGAAYGVIVAIFEWGWAKSAIGLQSTLPIPAYVPMLVFCIVFGLSMDYEVFLLSRVQEAWLATRDAHRAVAIGIGATARVITTAAPHHDRGVHQLRDQPESGGEDAGHRDGVRGADRRVAGPDVPGALDHDSARVARLVDAPLDGAGRAATAPGRQPGSSGMPEPALAGTARTRPSRPAEPPGQDQARTTHPNPDLPEVRRKPPGLATEGSPIMWGTESPACRLAGRRLQVLYAVAAASAKVAAGSPAVA